MDTLSVRRVHNFSDRNPPVFQEDFNRILKVLVASDPDQPDNGTYFMDIRTDYQRTGMTVADYDFETHLDQFYRLALFFIELVMRGVTSDEEDVYEGPLPNTMMPDVVQSIVHDDENYRKFLWMKLKRVARTQDENRNIDVLVLQLLENLSNSTATSGSTTTDRTVTIANSFSTTPKYDQPKKGKGVRKNKKKNPPSQPKTEQQRFKRSNRNSSDRRKKLTILMDI